jgi:hypothetical protein
MIYKYERRRKHRVKVLPSERFTSSGTLPSAKSVIMVCRVSCHRPLTPAFFLMFDQDVFSVTMGRVGSLGRGLPQGVFRERGGSVVQLVGLQIRLRQPGYRLNPFLSPVLDRVKAFLQSQASFLFGLLRERLARGLGPASDVLPESGIPFVAPVHGKSVPIAVASGPKQFSMRRFVL